MPWMAIGKIASVVGKGLWAGAKLACRVAVGTARLAYRTVKKMYRTGKKLYKNGKRLIRKGTARKRRVRAMGVIGVSSGLVKYATGNPRKFMTMTRGNIPSNLNYHPAYSHIRNALGMPQPPVQQCASSASSSDMDSLKARVSRLEKEAQNKQASPSPSHEFTNAETGVATNGNGNSANVLQNTELKESHYFTKNTGGGTVQSENATVETNSTPSSKGTNEKPIRRGAPVSLDTGVIGVAAYEALTRTAREKTGSETKKRSKSFIPKEDSTITEVRGKHAEGIPYLVKTVVNLRASKDAEVSKYVTVLKKGPLTEFGIPVYYVPKGTPEYEFFRKQISDLFKRKELSQDEFAKKIGVRQNLVSKWLTGSATGIRTVDLQKVCSKFPEVKSVMVYKPTSKSEASSFIKNKFLYVPDTVDDIGSSPASVL